MVKLVIELKFLKPELGLYLECPESITSLASQLIMGAPVMESVYQCTGFWTLLNGQLYFLNRKSRWYKKNLIRLSLLRTLKVLLKVFMRLTLVVYVFVTITRKGS